MHIFQSHWTESTDISHTSQLMIFIRVVDQYFNVSEELLKLVFLHETIKCVDIFNKLNNMISIHGGFQKCTTIVTNGANSMTGKNIGLTGLLKQNGIHCQMLIYIIHQ